MPNLNPHILLFLDLIKKGAIDLYNEDGLKCELALHFRSKLDSSWKVQVERNIDSFGLDKRRFIKKEMDIVVFDSLKKEKQCIELKYPTQGHYPEQMFKACQDVKFLEQLVDSGFQKSYFLMIAKDTPFFEGRETGGIYSIFRENRVIQGQITKPTGSKSEVINILGRYNIVWVPIINNLKYFILEVG
jgi:hypothetical protein